MTPPRLARAILFLSCSALGAACTKDPQPEPPPRAPAATQPAPQEKTMSLHDFTMKTIDGKDRSLADFRGQVVLVVNTASECGFTPQYAGLEKLHERFAPNGFAVLGFPSNDFGAQEPGSEADIKTFCSTKYGVTFPMFAKIPVKGPSKDPLYAFLTAAPPPGEVKWNFGKFLVGKDGQVIARYESNVEPDDAKLVAAIESATR
jgi:glutathione peroxidase